MSIWDVGLGFVCLNTWSANEICVRFQQTCRKLQVFSIKQNSHKMLMNGFLICPDASVYYDMVRKWENCLLISAFCVALFLYSKNSKIRETFCEC